MIRLGFGSKAALLISFYNVYIIRQQIIKHAIHLSRSKNPRVIKGASFLVGFGYTTALFIVWQLPFLCFDIGADVKNGVAFGTMMAMMPPS